MGEAGDSRGARVGWALAACWAAGLILEQWRPTPQIDDAYITYRYAENWAAGHGLVFNPGERVEGFTSPLFTAAVALGIVLGAPAPVAGHVLGLLGGVAAILATFAYARSLAPAQPAWVAGLAPVALLASASFVRWTTSGLETVVFSAGLVGALAARASGRIGATTGALAVTFLTRPEGALVAGLLFIDVLREPSRRAAALRCAAIFAGVGLLLVAARLAYYGEWLPNTFHAKVGGVPVAFGVAYLQGFLVDGALGLLLPAAAAAVLVAPARVGLLLCGLFMAYVVSIGGDPLGTSRFLLPLLPPLAALASVGAFAGWERSRAAGGVLAAVALASVAWLALGPAPPGEGIKRTRVLEHARKEDRFFEGAARARARLLRERDPDAWVATGAVGAFGYLSRMPTIDILGLTDRQVARAPLREGGAKWPGHMRSDADYVMSRQPDYILIRERDAPGAGRLRAVSELWAHPDLERHYVWDEEVRGYRRR